MARTGSLCTYIAFLRGINNIGAARRVKMADLRKLIESIGLSEVRTLLNSGNVIFAGPAGEGVELGTTIERALKAELGVSSSVIILTAKELRTAVSENPLTAASINPSNLLVLVPQGRSDLGRLKPLLDIKWSPEEFALGRRVAYLWCANGVARSPLWAAADKALEHKGTVRNLNTLSKAVALIEEERS
ncbi:MAG: DUF1697 domain-containing protein [Blastocatellales bacterium]